MILLSFQRALFLILISFTFLLVNCSSTDTKTGDSNTDSAQSTENQAKEKKVANIDVSDIIKESPMEQEAETYILRAIEERELYHHNRQEYA